MALETQILTIVEPKLKLETLSILDTETKDNKGIPQDTTFKKSETVGKLYPLIKIEGYSFDHTIIHKVEISETDFLPTITAILTDKTGAFSSSFFPKTNPILSIYIKGDNDKFKPIRNDYLILGIDSAEADDPAFRSTGVGTTITVHGILYIPTLMNRESKSYKDKSSYDALIDMCKYLQIGFSTNETLTNDKMTWMQPYKDYYAMAKHITAHAYKDDGSYFDIFIDKYYTMNFINLKNMFNKDLDFAKTFTNVVTQSRNMAGDSKQPDDSKTDLFLTNYSGMKGSALYISSYKPITQQGSVLASKGYIKRIAYYDTYFDKTDNPKNNFLEWTVSPVGIVTPDETKFPDLLKMTSGTFAGCDYGNAHDNYIHAYHMNDQYLMELNKMKLSIKTDGVNFNILKGQRIPIVIVQEGTNHTISQDAEVPIDPNSTEDRKEKEESGFKIDEYLSGFYVISDINYIYSQASGERVAWSTEIDLVKHEWKKSPEMGLDVKSENTLK